MAISMIRDPSTLFGTVSTSGAVIDTITGASKPARQAEAILAPAGL
jgi:hypothetical protein